QEERRHRSRSSHRQRRGRSAPRIDRGRERARNRHPLSSDAPRRAAMSLRILTPSARPRRPIPRWTVIVLGLVAVLNTIVPRLGDVLEVPVGTAAIVGSIVFAHW